jgi:hypothetical protein
MASDNDQESPASAGGASENGQETAARHPRAMLKATFRRKFNQQVFGILSEDENTEDGLSPLQRQKCNEMTQERWSANVKLIQNWSIDGKPNKEFRKANKQGYTALAKYYLKTSTTAGGAEVTHLMEKKSDRRVISQM